MTILGFHGAHPLALLVIPLALAGLFGGFWLLWRWRNRFAPAVLRGYLAVYALIWAGAAMAHGIDGVQNKYRLLYLLGVFACFAALNLALAAVGLYVRLCEASPTGPAGLAGGVWPHVASRRRFLAGGALAAAGTLVSMAGVDAATDSVSAVTERRIDLRRAPGAAPGRPLRLSLVTDTHAGFFLPSAYLRQAAERVAAFRPDVILFGGDLVEHGLDALDQVTGFFRDLTELAPVYAVLGNHDCYVNADSVAAFHRLNGVTPLRGETAPLAGPWGKFTLCGLRDWNEKTVSWNCLRGLNPASTILLVHNPQFGLKLPRDVSPWLTLSGHTHGGQLCLPGVGPLVNQADRRILAGLNTIDGRRMAVSAGIGYSGLPVRLLCPPDVTNIVVS